jgi:hypothetical protein
MLLYPRFNIVTANELHVSATHVLSANVWEMKRSGSGAETNRGGDKPLH